MNKQRVSLATKIWSDELTPQLLFQRMPALLNAFDFVTEETPQFTLFSDKYKAAITDGSIPIYFPGENRKPTWQGYNWAFTFTYDEEMKNPNHLRFPNYVRLGAGKDLIKNNIDAKEILQSKTEFCAFVYSHPMLLRDTFFKKLSGYKFVHSPGKHFHNTQDIDDYSASYLHDIKNMYKKYDDKVEYLKKFKFTICFENESSVGYTSEKIYHAMLANSIPIYWGNPLVHRDFNTRSFINFSWYDSMDKIIEYIKKIDNDDALYMEYLNQPWYPHNKLTRYTDTSRIVHQFRKIFKGR